MAGMCTMIAVVTAASDTGPSSVVGAGVTVPFPPALF
jgi:hypothetical protein